MERADAVDARQLPGQVTLSSHKHLVIDRRLELDPIDPHMH
jgi:hypothetical protein